MLTMSHPTHHPILVLGLAALLSLSASAQNPPVQGDGQTRPLVPQPLSGEFPALPASDFIDSIGVCAHLGRTQTNYVTRFAELKPLILELGIRHIRTDPVQAPEAVKNVRELGAAGVKFNFLVHGGRDVGFVAEYLTHIKDNFAACVESIEGLNEPDRRPDAAKAWLVEMRRVAAQEPLLARLPIVGSALAHPWANGDKVGDWSGLVDLANMHAYPGGRAPELSITEYRENLRPQYGSTLKYLNTETGYHSALHNPPERHKPTALHVQAVYMPRLHLEYFRLGFLRSYKYQLLDDRTEEETRTKYRGQPVQEAHFGYIDYDFKPKPSYHAVKNLITILNDPPGAYAAPRSLTYTLAGPVDLRHVLLQKSDGSLYLAVWRAVSIWDPVARRDEPVETVPVAVRLQAPFKSARLFRPTHSAEPFSTLAPGKEIPLSLGAEVVIIALR